MADRIQQITLSPSLSVPLMDFATQGNAILGIRDSGKSYTATYFAERLLDAGIPFLAFDPIGIWRHLKNPSGRPDGKGYPVVVAGEDGDIPLSPDNAAEIVRAAMKENIPLVVDLFSMHLAKADWRRIVETCVSVLLYENRQLRHVFIEEAAEFCPQRVGPDMGRVYASIEKLARMGGNRYLGYTLINQRAEAVNKEVLELCDCLFLHRQKGKNSLLSLQKWLDVADASRAREVVSSLPTLPQGDCWVWTQSSTGPVRVSIPRKRSLHPDRRNPSAGTSTVTADVAPFVVRMKDHLAKKPERHAPKVIATPQPNLKETGEIQRLRSQVENLQAQLTELRSQPPREIPVISSEQAKALAEAVSQLSDHTAVVQNLIESLKRIPAGVQSAKPALHTTNKAKPTPPAPPASRGAAIVPNTAIGGSGVRRMMIALAQRPGLTERQLGLRAALSSRSGTFRNYLSLLRKNGWLEKNGNGHLELSHHGHEALGAYTPLPTGESLRHHWLNELGKGPAKMLSALASVYPSGLTTEELADRCEMAISGTFRNYLSHLRGFELIVTQAGRLYASTELFEEQSSG